MQAARLGYDGTEWVEYIFFSWASIEWEALSCVIFSLRGVGCIFIEMIQGVAAFPGMKDIQDQLERIFLVSHWFCSV